MLCKKRGRREKRKKGEVAGGQVYEKKKKENIEEEETGIGRGRDRDRKKGRKVEEGMNKTKK